MKFLLAILLAVSIPAFGQEVQQQLATQLHETCVAQTQETLQLDLSIKVMQPLDMGKFCAYADVQIREDRVLEYMAGRPADEREPSSALMAKLRRAYFLGGLERYWKATGWPQKTADKDARPLDEIRVALERRKGAIYADYRRALKDKPGLAGKVIVEFTIEPSGSVTGVDVKSTELTDAAFLGALKSQIEALQFPAEPVRQMVAKYPIDFRPH